MKTIYLSILIILSTSIELFSQNDKSILFQTENFVFPYNLNKASSSIKLPKVLNEISGLSFYKKNTVVGIQDEKGSIYFINTLTGKIIESLNLEKAGDYEGVELINQDVWMMKSNGTLYQITNYANSRKRKNKKHKTSLSAKNNCEGLGYAPQYNYLLIACKGFPYTEKIKNGKSEKTIYAFDLKNNSLIPKPIITIDLDSLKQYFEYNTMARIGIKLLSAFNTSNGDLTFQPSAIAVHPITNDYYILGSVGNLLLVYNSKNEMKAIVKLDTNLLPQPEGICFDSNGNLYISNEGKEKKASIHTFKIYNQN